ncbi:MAG: DUF5615 family PIN-like protein, partial [Chthoniobacterales bacterium]
MKLLIDVSLSPTWAPFLNERRIVSTHWSTIGKVDAPDQEIFEYAIAHEFVIFTHDLDFGAILAHTKFKRPSVGTRSRAAPQKS